MPNFEYPMRRGAEEQNLMDVLRSWTRPILLQTVPLFAKNAWVPSPGEGTTMTPSSLNSWARFVRPDYGSDVLLIEIQTAAFLHGDFQFSWKYYLDGVRDEDEFSVDLSKVFLDTPRLLAARIHAKIAPSLVAVSRPYRRGQRVQVQVPFQAARTPSPKEGSIGQIVKTEKARHTYKYLVDFGAKMTATDGTTWKASPPDRPLQYYYKHHEITTAR